MILTDQWNLKDKTSSFITVYGKIRYFLLCCYMPCGNVFCVSVLADWKCKWNVIENIFIFMYLVVVYIAPLMPKSQETKEIINSVYNLENKKLKTESTGCFRTYMSITKQNNQIVIFFTGIIVFAAVSWLFAPRR